MSTRTVIVTNHDLNRLRSMAFRRIGDRRDLVTLDRLMSKLEVALATPPEAIPADIITMNSEFEVRDLATGESATWTLVFPAEADFEKGRISVLAPAGVALLGTAVGDVVEYRAPGGTCSLRVVRIAYQPELVGDYLR